MGEGAAITAGFRDNPNRLRALDPSLRRKHEVVAPSLIFKPLEFERFKKLITEFLPKPNKFNGAPAAHPVVNNCKRLLRVAISGNISQGNVIRSTLGYDCDSVPLNLDRGFFGLWHGERKLEGNRMKFFTASGRC